ncbi:MAG TPA: amidohydrolase family protein [Anaerolineaceae bacterium]|jgi:carbamoyl-phosphate synthase/aspartate carbamoyltransferase/dihydroorotase|nr:amidohydrolase family protein [Anaerolineaceae bacterium]
MTGGLMILPGLVDVHVHLRSPGGEHKEDFRTGSAAALAGGFTTLLAMPNTQPPLVSLDYWRVAQNQAISQSLCDVFLYAGASAEHLDQLPLLSARAPALKIYLDQTYGPLRVRGLNVLERIMVGWNVDKPICLHAEEESVAVGIALAAVFNRHIHFCHVSRQSEIELIARAKERGLPVTCEVTPHHLFLNENDARRLGPYGDMRPALASSGDQAALWEHINSTVDCIASDHAPHTRAEKERPEGAPPGVPGLESTLPLMLTAVAQGRLSAGRLEELLARNPRRIFNLPEQAETWVEVDPEAEFVFPEHPLYTKCGWSPFEGMRLRGRITRVVLRGREVVRDGIVLNYQKL